MACVCCASTSSPALAPASELTHSLISQSPLCVLQGSTPDDLCAVVYDVVARTRARVLPRPVFTVSSDGALATSIDFIRLQKVRKGKQNTICPDRDCEASGRQR